MSDNHEPEISNDSYPDNVRYNVNIRYCVLLISA